MVRLSSQPVSFQWSYRFLLFFLLALFLLTFLRQALENEIRTEMSLVDEQETVKLAWFYLTI